jgi:hypothetical protein
LVSILTIPCSIDVKDKFRIYRRDIADTLISPYNVIHNEMILLLLQDIKMDLSRHGSIEYNEQVSGELHIYMERMTISNV